MHYRVRWGAGKRVAVLVKARIELDIRCHQLQVSPVVVEQVTILDSLSRVITVQLNKIIIRV